MVARFVLRPAQRGDLAGQALFLEDILEVGAQVGGQAVGLFLRRNGAFERIESGLERIVVAQGEVIAGFEAQQNRPRTGGSAARAEIIGQGFQIVGGAGLEETPDQ